MNKILTIFVFSLTTLVLNSVVYAEFPPPETNTTVVSSYKKDQIIGYYDEGGNLVDKSQARYYRKYLGKTPEDYFLIQNFYQGSNRKDCDPVTIKSESNLDTWRLTTAEGKHVLWYENGQKRTEGLYKNGYRSGRWIWLFENGQKYMEIHYSRNEKEQLWTIWSEDGQKKALEGYFVNGHIERRWTWWYENGQKKLEGHFKKGEPVGKWTEWDEEGNKQSVDVQTIKETYSGW